MSSVASLANTVTPTAFARARPRRRLAAAGAVAARDGMRRRRDRRSPAPVRSRLHPRRRARPALRRDRPPRHGLPNRRCPRSAPPTPARSSRAARGLCGPRTPSPPAAGEPAAARPRAGRRACPPRLGDAAAGGPGPGRGAAPAGAGRRRRARLHRRSRRWRPGSRPTSIASGRCRRRRGPAAARCASEWAGAALATRRPAPGRRLAEAAKRRPAPRGAAAGRGGRRPQRHRRARRRRAAGRRRRPGCATARRALAGTAAILGDARQSTSTRARTRRCARCCPPPDRNGRRDGARPGGALEPARRGPGGAGVALVVWAVAACGARAVAVRRKHGFDPARAGHLEQPARAVRHRAARGRRRPGDRRSARSTARGAARQAMARASATPGSCSRPASAGWCCSTCRPTAIRQPLSRALSPGPLWLAMLLLCVAAFLREPLGARPRVAARGRRRRRARIARRVGFGRRGARAARRRSRRRWRLASVALANMRQLTSELGRLWLIVGAAWFFFLRGTPLTERLARSGGSLRLAGALRRAAARWWSACWSRRCW